MKHVNESTPSLNVQETTSTSVTVGSFDNYNAIWSALHETVGTNKTKIFPLNELPTNTPVVVIDNIPLLTSDVLINNENGNFEQPDVHSPSCLNSSHQPGLYASGNTPVDHLIEGTAPPDLKLTPFVILLVLTRLYHRMTTSSPRLSLIQGRLQLKNTTKEVYLLLT